MTWGPCSVQELTAEEQAHALASMSILRKAQVDKKKVKPKYRLVGIASTEHEDLQEDIIERDGLDFSRAISRGFFNDDHGKKSADVIGYPTRVFPITINDNGKKVRATGVEGYIFDNERGRNIAELAMKMQGTDREMGLSVEGPPPMRRMSDRKRIAKAVVEHIAVTPWPVNPHTKAEISLVKSFGAALRTRLEKGAHAGYPGDEGPGSLRPVMPQSLGSGLSIASYYLDLSELKKLMEDWSPSNTLMKSRRLNRTQAARVIRRRFPQATEDAVDRILALAAKETP